jgi:hypothetical protein
LTHLWSKPGRSSPRAFLCSRRKMCGKWNDVGLPAQGAIRSNSLAHRARTSAHQMVFKAQWADRSPDSYFRFRHDESRSMSFSTMTFARDIVELRSSACIKQTITDGTPSRYSAVPQSTSTRAVSQSNTKEHLFPAFLSFEIRSVSSAVNLGRGTRLVSPVSVHMARPENGPDIRSDLASNRG